MLQIVAAALDNSDNAIMDDDSSSSSGDGCTDPVNSAHYGSFY